MREIEAYKILEAYAKSAEMMPMQDGDNPKPPMMDPKETPDGDGTYNFVASKEVIDRVNDIIKIAGIDTSEYEKNPIFLWMHDDRSLPIGKCVSIGKGIDDMGVPQMTCAVEFANTEDGQTAKYLFDNGFLRAVSVRIAPTDYAWNEDRGGYDIHACKLYEISAVNIPANQEALMMKALAQRARKTELKSKGFEARLCAIEARANRIEDVIAKSVNPDSPRDAANDGSAALQRVLEFAKSLKSK